MLFDLEAGRSAYVGMRSQIFLRDRFCTFSSIRQLLSQSTSRDGGVGCHEANEILACRLKSFGSRLQALFESYVEASCARRSVIFNLTERFKISPPEETRDIIPDAGLTFLFSFCPLLLRFLLEFSHVHEDAGGIIDLGFRGALFQFPFLLR